MKISSIRSPDQRARQQLYKLGGYDLHRMRLYLRDMIGMLKKESVQIAQDHKAERRRYPQQAQMIDEVYYRRIEDHQNTFVGYLLNSSLVAAASIFEDMLKKVCHFAGYKTHTKFEVPRQQIIQKCQAFIRQCHVDLDLIEDEWLKLEMMLNVRHQITHQGATFRYEKNVFDPKEKSIINHIKSSPYIEVKHPRSKQDKEFQITDRLYVFDFLDQAHDYLVWILMQLPERRPKRSKKINRTTSKT